MKKEEQLGYAIQLLLDEFVIEVDSYTDNELKEIIELLKTVLKGRKEL